MAELSIPSAGKPTRTALRYLGTGVIDEPIVLGATTANSAPTSQRVYGMLMGLRAGDSVTGIVLRLSTAAAGSNPAGVARFGIADSTGKMLAISGDLGAATNWTLGAAPFAFASPYVATVDGAYYGAFVVNGTWGTTQPLLAGTSFASTGSGLAAAGASAPFFTWDSQTDLPAVNSSLTMTSSTAIRYMAFYGSAVSA